MFAYQGVKSKDKEVPHDKPEVELPSKRLRTRSQRKQALSKEECSKSNLVKTGSEQNDQNVADFDSDTELEDPSPLVKRKRSRNQDELALVPMDKPVSVVVGEDELSWTYCMAEATHPYVSDDQSHSKPGVHFSTNRFCRKNQIKQDLLQEEYSKSWLPITASKPEHHDFVDFHSDSEPEDPEPLLRRKRLRHQNELALVSVDDPVLVHSGEDELSLICYVEEVAEETHPYVSDKKSPSTADLAQQCLRKEGMRQNSPLEKTELCQTYPSFMSPHCKENNSKMLEADCRDNILNSEGGNDLIHFKTSRDKPCFDHTLATDVLDLYHNNSLEMLRGEQFIDEQQKNEVPLMVTHSGTSIFYWFNMGYKISITGCEIF